MEQDYSFSALKEFLHFIADKGLLGGSTAQGWRVATSKLLQDLSASEEGDVRKIDLDIAARKFVNKNPGKLSPRTLGIYRRRVGSAIEEFIKWSEDPAGYRPRGGNVLSRKTASERAARGRSGTVRREKDSKVGEHGTVPANSTDTTPSASAGLPLSFPLRPDFLAQVVVPIDMTLQEARRLGAFLQTLSTDFEAQ